MEVRDLEKQRAFIDMLREGNVLTDSEIRCVFSVKDAHKFVVDIQERTGLDIREGKQSINTCYFIASNIRFETAGLDEMSEATEDILTETEEFVEHQNGHYIMWVCPTETGNIEDGYEYCGQFHKVDLGDEELSSPKTVQCVQCGRRYQVKPREY
jgi:hypothetical protein